MVGKHWLLVYCRDRWKNRSNFTEPVHIICVPKTKKQRQDGVIFYNSITISKKLQSRLRTGWCSCLEKVPQSTDLSRLLWFLKKTEKLWCFSIHFTTHHNFPLNFRLCFPARVLNNNWEWLASQFKEVIISCSLIAACLQLQPVLTVFLSSLSPGKITDKTQATPHCSAQLQSLSVELRDHRTMTLPQRPWLMRLPRTPSQRPNPQNAHVSAVHREKYTLLVSIGSKS